MKTNTVKNVIIGILIMLVFIGFIPKTKPLDPIEQAKQTLTEESERIRKQADKLHEDNINRMTTAQKQAFKKAEAYLEYSAFSNQSLIDQLLFEGFDREDIRMAMLHLNVDWEEQAYLKAVSYLSSSAFSKQRLIEQLEFEGFTHEQAVFGANKAY